MTTIGRFLHKLFHRPPTVEDTLRWVAAWPDPVKAEMAEKIRAMVAAGEAEYLDVPLTVWAQVFPGSSRSQKPSGNPTPDKPTSATPPGGEHSADSASVWALNTAETEPMSALTSSLTLFSASACSPPQEIPMATRDSSHREHALCAPSDAKRWLNCAGAIAMCADVEKGSSAYADEGTWAHGIAAAALLGGKVSPEDHGRLAKDGHSEYIGTYVDQILARVQQHRDAGATVELLVETRLDLEPITGEPGAGCTLDVLIVAEYLTHTVLEVRDLKYGAGVAVSVVENPQLMIYALAAMRRFSTLPVEEVILGIHQPRITSAPSEWSVGVDELMVFEKRVREAASLALDLYYDARSDAHKYLAKEPGEEICRWCPIKATCPSFSGMVHETVYSEFQAVDDDDAVPLNPETENPNVDLGRAILRVEAIELWCREVRAEVERRLLAGKPVVTPKGPMWLKVGREGARKWTDADAAEKLLQTAGLANVIYSKPALLSPTQIEKVASKRPVWENLQDFITREPGKPSVAFPGDSGTPYAAPDADEFDSYDGSSLV